MVVFVTAGLLSILGLGFKVLAVYWTISAVKEYKVEAYSMEKKAEIGIAQMRKEEKIGETELVEDAKTTRMGMKQGAEKDAREAATDVNVGLLKDEVVEQNKSMDKFDARTTYIIALMEKNGVPVEKILKYAEKREKERMSLQSMLDNAYKYIDQGEVPGSAVIKAAASGVGKALGITPIASLKKRGMLPRIDVYKTMPLPEIAIDGDVKLKKNPLA
jgi:hypothetical protein|tara:strand:+ start:316 stop:966 length:651 start_codon:yes stop_codon:yes gene_type:complete